MVPASDKVLLVASSHGKSESNSPDCLYNKPSPELITLIQVTQSPLHPVVLGIELPTLELWRIHLSHCSI
jgi:hypothetical protein